MGEGKYREASGICRVAPLKVERGSSTYEYREVALWYFIASLERPGGRDYAGSSIDQFGVESNSIGYDSGGTKYTRRDNCMLETNIIQSCIMQQRKAIGDSSFALYSNHL